VYRALAGIRTEPGRKLRSILESLLTGKDQATRLTTVNLAFPICSLISLFLAAMGEGVADRNPAESLFTPRCRAGRERRSLTPKDIILILEVLDLRERLIVKLAIFEGMRPGENFGAAVAQLR
jgi:integrase